MDAFLEATASRWAKMPEKIALKEGIRRSNFRAGSAGQLHGAQACRQWCRDRRVRRLPGPTGIPFVVTCWACLKAGMTFMPISPKFPDKSVVDILTTATRRPSFQTAFVHRRREILSDGFTR